MNKVLKFLEISLFVTCVSLLQASSQDDENQKVCIATGTNS
ncbi:MAG: hypothetical protein NT128_00950 [Proteobacteria bacterium]|nr:hypothetical protein [Pseudomonadota bacterium]